MEDLLRLAQALAGTPNAGRPLPTVGVIEPSSEPGLAADFLRQLGPAFGFVHAPSKVTTLAQWDEEVELHRQLDRPCVLLCPTSAGSFKLVEPKLRWACEVQIDLHVAGDDPRLAFARVSKNRFGSTGAYWFQRKI